VNRSGAYTFHIAGAAVDVFDIEPLPVEGGRAYLAGTPVRVLG